MSFHSTTKGLEPSTFGKVSEPAKGMAIAGIVLGIISIVIMIILIVVGVAVMATPEWQTMINEL